MAYSGIELALHRAGTQEFINADPTTIVLVPRQVQMVNGTKKASDLSPLAPQTFKIIWSYDNGVTNFISDDAGGTRRFDFILVGTYDALVGIGHHWRVGDQDFEIEYVFPGNGYEVKAGGISHGPSPT